MRNGLHGDFDRGYFSAWADCMRILIRMNIPSDKSRNSTDAEKTKIETLKSDKSQATIANFLREDKEA
jgi:predicted RND superfamily exporter protein